MLRGKTYVLGILLESLDGVPLLRQHGKMDRLTRQPHRWRNYTAIASHRYSHRMSCHRIGLIDYPTIPECSIFVAITLCGVTVRSCGQLSPRERNTNPESVVLHQPYHPRAGQPPESPIDAYVSLWSLRAQLHVGEVRITRERTIRYRFQLWETHPHQHRVVGYRILGECLEVDTRYPG